MYAGRGRGKPIQVRSPTLINYPKPGPICVGTRKKLSIVYSTIGRCKGKFPEVIIEQTERIDQDETRFSAAKTNLLLFEGIFSMPNDPYRSLDSAPNRIITKILSFVNDVKTLAACECVCRRWCSIIKSSGYYKNQAKLKVKTMNFQVVKASALTCTFEKNPTPSNDKKGDFDFYKIVWRIPAVYARNSYVLAKVSGVFDKFQIVRTLGYMYMSISDELLNLLVEKQTGVEQLRFLRCFIDGNALTSLKAIRGIKELAIDHCFGLGDSISSKSILPFLQQNVCRRFELSGAEVLAYVDNTVMEALLTNWKYDKFDFLKLTNCPAITTEAIGKVVNHYVRLEKSRLFVFLQNTGFNVEKFLSTQDTFRETQFPTTQRVCLASNSGVVIWVEK